MFFIKGVLKNFVKLIGETCARVRPQEYKIIKKETLAQVFPSEFWEIIKNTFFNRAHPVAASAHIQLEIVIFKIVF